MFQMILIYILLLNSMMFYYSKTPNTMGLILLLQTILTSLFSGMMSMSFWYTYIMFLVMIGGMLILFIYMSSLSSNQKFYLFKNKILLNSCIIMLIFIMFKYLNIFTTFNIDSMNFINMNLEENYNLKMSMNKLYNLPTNMIMFMMMNYLLLTLFIVVEITSIKMGPLRKNN